ncbi:MAG: RnfABCDGE type electron transport complex subunit E [Bacteroidales bacterium]|nr:RnfABCDGE type electron transport complex subunit E [Bacteroidales bacterium]
MINENPTFVQLLGMCPTLAVTTSLKNGIGMGLSATAVLIASNALIALLRKIIPEKVRIAAYIVIIAAFVTIIEMLLNAYLPSLASELGIFIPLIVVNCIVLGRAEAFACKNSVLDSALDGIGIGLGFSLSLTVIGFVRELLGGLSVFNTKLCDGDGMLAFVLAPGAFIALGYLMVLFNKAQGKK